MPGREIRFTNGGIYHVFNRTVDAKRIFVQKKLCLSFLDAIKYYRSQNSKISMSRLRDLLPDDRKIIEKSVLFKTSFRVHVLAYCLMPTHFHFLLQQKKSDGIQKVLSDVVNSFTQYFNRATKRRGPLFMPRFKAVQVLNDAQLMHVSRYIHLNPYSARQIKSKEEIEQYPYSSFSQYIHGTRSDITHPEKVLELFSNNPQAYKSFVIQNADYQQTLEHVKYTYKW